MAAILNGGCYAKMEAKGKYYITTSREKKTGSTSQRMGMFSADRMKQKSRKIHHVDSLFSDL